VVCHQVENINWMRVSSDLEINTAEQFCSQGDYSLARKPKVENKQKTNKQRRNKQKTNNYRWISVIRMSSQ